VLLQWGRWEIFGSCWSGVINPVQHEIFCSPLERGREGPCGCRGVLNSLQNTPLTPLKRGTMGGNNKKLPGTLPGSFSRFSGKKKLSSL